MKTLYHFSIAASILGLLLAQAARAESIDLHVHDRNARVAVSIGTAPRSVIMAVPAPVECHRTTYRREHGYWATDGYRQVWITPTYPYSGYREQPPSYRDHDRQYRNWHHHEWRNHHHSHQHNRHQ